MYITDTEGENEDIATDTGNESTPTVEDTEDSEDSDSVGNSSEIQKEPVANPFATGKEKFKVNGEEHEWDWDTTKRYAQLGRSGQLAMERAAQTEEKAKTAYQKLMKAAQDDPEGLIRVLNPNYQGSRSKTSAQQDAGDVDGNTEDPRDRRIAQLEKDVAKFSGHFESQEVNQARQEIDAELDASAKQFPIMTNDVYRQYVKSEYRRYLESGITDISIEDIAFSVQQKAKEEKLANDTKRKASLDIKRKNSTSPSISGSSGSSDRKEGESGIDFAKRVAGMQ